MVEFDDLGILCSLIHPVDGNKFVKQKQCVSLMILEIYSDLLEQLVIHGVQQEVREAWRLGGQIYHVHNNHVTTFLSGRLIHDISYITPCNL